MSSLSVRARSCRALGFALSLGFGAANSWAEDDLVALRRVVSAEARQAPGPTLPRATFLVRPTIRSPRLAPDGERLAFLLDREGRTGLWLAEPTAGKPRRLLPDTDASELAWSQDGRWLFLVSARQVAALPLANQPGGGVVSPLGVKERRRLLGIDPSRPAAVLITQEERPPGSNPLLPSSSSRYQLLRQAPGAPAELLFESDRRILAATFTADGRLTHLGLVAGAEHVVVAVEPAGGPREITRCTPVVDLGCRLVATSADGATAFLVGSGDGDLARLWQLGPDGAARPWHGDPRGEADLDEVTHDLVTGVPRIASYRSTEARSYGLDAEATRYLQAIENHLPGRDLRFQIGRASWLVSERGGDQHGERLYVFDLARERLTPVLDDYQPAWAPREALARKIPFTYPASDGLRVRGFLLVPSGGEPSRRPLVVLVHGGPWNHVGPEFDTVAQWLVNRGFAVFQPNFRGSTGHGRVYLEAARGDFGNGRVQQDIVDGVRYLLAAGIGDPQRVAITGGSFGGYSTLVGLTFQPELFQVGVAFVPPPDFGWAVEWNTRQTEGSVAAGVPLRDSLAALGLGTPEIRERLRRESPRAHAAQLSRPVVLVAAGQDDRVALRSVLQYAATLDVLGKDVTLYVEPEAGHGIEDDLSREMLLYLLEATFHQHLGGPEPAPPSQELAEKLAQDRRLGGQ